MAVDHVFLIIDSLLGVTVLRTKHESI